MILQKGRLFFRQTFRRTKKGLETTREDRAVPGVPQRISAAEISRSRNNICIILVTWDPSASNSNTSDIDKYIIYIPSQDIRDVSSSTLTTLTVLNCDDDIRIQVAAMNRDGCVGMISSGVQPILLDIPTTPTDNRSFTTGGGSQGGPTLSSTFAVAAASVAAVLFVICVVVVLGLVLFSVLYTRFRGKKIQDAEQDDLQKKAQDTLVKRNMDELYSALKLKLPSRKMQAAARDLKATLVSGMKSLEFNEKVKEVFISCLEVLQSENDKVVQRVIENMDSVLTGMTSIDEKFKKNVRLLRTKIGTGEHKEVLDKLIKKMEKVQSTTIMSILLSLCEKLRNVRQVKDYVYCKQSKYDIGDLGTEEDRVSVPIWIDDELDDSWKDSLGEAVQAINEAAPGLSLSITKDKKRAVIHVLAIDKKDSEQYTEIEGNILMRLKEKKFVTIIRLGKWKDDGKKGVCIHELFHALGFHHEHQYAITDVYVYHLDSGKKITINKNELGFIYFDAFHTILYPCKEKCRENSEGHVCIWVLKEYPTQEYTVLNELDRVRLNLIYPPCVDETESSNVRYRPKLGKTGIYYCGRIKVVLGQKHPKEGYACPCGPDKGPNCSACRTIKSPRVEEILDGGRWQGMSGLVYCGRPFIEPGILFPIHDGMCGMNNGPACPDCNNILNKEHVQSASHPRTWVQ